MRLGIRCVHKAREGDAKEEGVPEPGDFMNKDKVPSLKDRDYAFRPSKLSSFPFCIFSSRAAIV